jgi:hypothetical protein
MGADSCTRKFCEPPCYLGQGGLVEGLIFTTVQRSSAFFGFAFVQKFFGSGFVRLSQAYLAHCLIQKSVDVKCFLWLAMVDANLMQLL